MLDQELGRLFDAALHDIADPTEFYNDAIAVLLEEMGQKGVAAFVNYYFKVPPPISAYNDVLGVAGFLEGVISHLTRGPNPDAGRMRLLRARLHQLGYRRWLDYPLESVFDFSEVEAWKAGEIQLVKAEGPD